MMASRSVVLSSRGLLQKVSVLSALLLAAACSDSAKPTPGTGGATQPSGTGGKASAGGATGNPAGGATVPVGTGGSGAGGGAGGSSRRDAGSGGIDAPSSGGIDAPSSGVDANTGGASDAGPLDSQGGLDGSAQGGGPGTGGRATGGAGGRGGTGGGGAGTGGSTSGLWVIGSHPDYQWQAVPANQVPWSHLTHLVLEFLEPTGSNGSYGLDVTGYGPSTMSAWKTAAQAYITAAHNAGVKVICSLGGEGLGGTVFTEATGSVAKSDALAATIASILIDIGFDGVDVDWEESYNATGAARLVHSLRGAWPTAILTTSIGPTYGDEQVQINRTLAAVKDDVDGYMIMLYIPGDQTWTWWVVPVPLTPLHGTPVPWDGSKQLYSADRELEVWKGLGVPSNKLILGVGGFGLAWVDSNRDKIAPVAPYANYNALANDPTCSASPWTCAAAADTEVAPSPCSDNRVTQKWVDQVVTASNGALQLKTDTVGDVTYWAAPASNQLVTVASPCGSGTVDVGLIFYESPASMASKASYCNTNGLRGMEFWTMGQMVNAEGRYPNLEAVKP